LTYQIIIDILLCKINGDLKMKTITISPKYQIVIPKEIRRELKLKPGQKLQVIQAEDRVEYIILKDIKEARGFLKGMNTNILREKDRI
jgi:AbrB family looped-hinge helix DNA binding protein